MRFSGAGAFFQLSSFHSCLEVDLKAIIHNFRLLKSIAGSETQILAVLKADAYGIGAVPIAKTLIKEGLDYIGVALAAEAKILRESGIISRILLMSPPFTWDIPQIVDLGIEVVLSDLKTAQLLSCEAGSKNKTIKVHIKINTGMQRLGILPEELSQLVRGVHVLPNLNIGSIYTHFPRADEDDNNDTLAAQDTFQNAVIECLEYSAPNSYSLTPHVANSAVILNLPSLSSNLKVSMKMARPGILLYGYPPSMNLSMAAKEFKPAVRLKSRIIQLRYLDKGVPVGYGGTYKTPSPGWLAVISIGYGDGYPRQMSNTGFVLIGGNRYPVAGRVCMDHTMVFCGSDKPDCGDEVVLLGTQGNEEITMAEWQERLDTIPHEILCRFTPRLPRIYLQ